MELEKIRNLSDDELVHQEKTTSEQLFRLRFQVSMGQNDGVKKIRLLRKEIAQIKTVAKERDLGIRGAARDAAVDARADAESKTVAKERELGIRGAAKEPQAETVPAAVTKKKGAR
jgi:large subunit ribosomal protein L29